MQISNNGINLIKQFEGCKLTAYQDTVGIWTIGYGWTQPVNGKTVARGMIISQATANQLLVDGVAQYERGVTNMLTTSVNQNQFDALVSFAYNLGISALKGSTLLKKLNSGDRIGAAEEFIRWNKAGGKVLSGLTKRRAAERSLFLCQA